jgi:glycosyltransferase involved in cell wall biosynthesis
VKKLLWIGDAVAATGFARCTHETLNVLRETWDVHVLGLNYMGDPHGLPYPVYPCWPGGDAFGIKRLPKLMDQIRPDVVIIQNDPWNIVGYLQALPAKTKVIATMPVDGKNCRLGYDLMRYSLLKKQKETASLQHAIFWTNFALDEARRGGGLQSWGADVIPLGVDTDTYAPISSALAREKIGLSDKLKDAFIVGNVNRNQPRKRLDLTVRYFARWIREYKHDDAFLFLHVCPTGEQCYDLRQLKRYYDTSRDWLVLVEPNVNTGAPEELMPYVYGSFDVQVSTTQGEGWGFTTMEGMACGVPQIVPDWAALSEWARPAAVLVPCTSTIATPNGINVIGGIADDRLFVEALEHQYVTRHCSDEYLGWLSARRAGLELVTRPEYRWSDIGRRFAEVVERVSDQD